MAFELIVISVKNFETKIKISSPTATPLLPLVLPSEVKGFNRRRLNGIV